MARKFYAEYCPYGAGYNLRNQLYIFRAEDVRNGWVLSDPDTRRKVCDEYASDFYHAEALQIREGKQWEKAKLIPAVEVSISGRVTAHDPFTPSIYEATKCHLWHVCITQGQLFSDALISGTEFEMATFVKHSIPVGASFGWEQIAPENWLARYPHLPVQHQTTYELRGNNAR